MRAVPIDAVLLVSFGGPEKPDDVVPFLENVTRGRGIPRERLAEVGQHYFLFGGRSPINDQCRALKAELEEDLRADGPNLPVYWGNRNWDPYLSDTLARMRADGVRRAACLFTSAYASYSGCRQYRENLADALAEVGEGAPELVRLPHYFNRPGFVAPFVDGTAEALEGLPAGSRIVFVTHSVPEAMNDASGPEGGRYVAEHRDVATAVAGEVAARTGREAGWDLVYCSRSGPPSQPWLGPDVNDHLTALAGQGVRGVAVVPIGFVSDHMEVLYDLDTEARATADRLGLAFTRVATPGIDPRFVRMVGDLVRERVAADDSEHDDSERGGGEPGSVGDVAPTGLPELTGSLGPTWGNCPAGCCRNLRGDRPAACGTD